MQQIPLNAFDLSVFVDYMVLTVGLGFWVAGKNRKTTRGYFLGGKTLPWYVVATSMIAADISSDDLIANAGAAYKYGIVPGTGSWNAYDIVFRAARFTDGKLTEKAMLTMYFNGVKVHTNRSINQVWGGPNSGIDGGNDGGKGITDVPGGLKLQAEGHDLRYRNIWIRELDLKEPNTDF